MKFFTGLMVVFFTTICSSLLLRAQNFNGVAALTERIAPWTKGKIVFHSLNDTAHERFELLTQNNKLHIYASSTSAASMGFNYYLNHFCHQQVSHCEDNLKQLLYMPVVKEKVTIETAFRYRYALNYCTYNYSFAFFQWKDWEKELDWMALHGVNLMLAVNGTEIIWQKTLQHFGFSDAEIKNFIPGPAYTAWWLMGNLEGWGGPVTDGMINRQMLLQEKILKRMKELGIQPVMQGFYGMVPNLLKKKFPTAFIFDQGKWAGGFQRPAFLSPQDSLFVKIADVYYQNIKEVYGDCLFFGGDPFHEGGNANGIDVSASAKIIQQQMQKHFPGSSWILQGWASNPSKELLRDLNKEKILVLDMKGESQSNWELTDAYGGFSWIWGCINNFGETPGLSGNLERIMNEPRRALETAQGKYLKGIGFAPEGILNNPLLYDAVQNVAWGKLQHTDSLLNEYMLYRYGSSDDNIFKGLLLLKKTVYAGGSGESLFAARPSTDVKSVSTWGSVNINYDNAILQNALGYYLKAATKYRHSKTFQFDITNIARQVLSNRGHLAYDSAMKFYREKNVSKYRQYKNQFFQLLQWQDELMATQKNSLTGNWLQQARAFGHTDYEKRLAEKNARMQITIWGPDNNPATDLHDYAHKEWAGLIKDLYLPRWKAFFAQLDNELSGKQSATDFYKMELKWTQLHNSYPVKSSGDYVRLIKKHL